MIFFSDLSKIGFVQLFSRIKVVNVQEGKIERFSLN